MNSRARFAFAQARMQARLSGRPDAVAWRRLEASKSLAHYIENARRAGLSFWLGRLSANADAHTIERGMRADWRAFTREVSDWLPTDWRAAVRWTGALPSLPLAARQRREGATPTEADKELAAAGVEDFSDADDRLAAWTARFRALRPKMRAADEAALDRLMELLAGDHPSTDVPRRVLEKTFRRQTQRPAAVFAFLGLTALDWGRLRGDLVRRSLFPENVKV